MFRLLIIALFALVFAGRAHAQIIELTAKPNSLVEIEPTTVSAVLPLDPIELDFRAYELAGGGQVILFHTGNLRRIFLAAVANNPNGPVPILVRYRVTIEGTPPGPGPGPDPGPGPEPPTPLTGLAKKLFEQGRDGRLTKNQARGLAQVFEILVSKIAAGALTTRGQIQSEMQERVQAIPLPGTARPMTQTLTTHFNTVVGQSVERARQACEQMAQAMRALEAVR